MARSRSGARRSARSMPRGTIVVHAEGYGFAHTAEGEFFIPSAKLGGAFDGDLVEIAPLSASASKAHRFSERDAMRSASRPVARVVRVIERAHESVIGRYEVADPFGVVIPEDPRIPYDIFTQRSASPDVPHGALVRVRITTYPSRKTAATGVVEEVLGEADGLRIGIESIIARHKLETRFSDACLKEANGLRLDVETALSRGYADLRGRCVFTTDPVDARDFDDALSLERIDGGVVASWDPSVSAGEGDCMCGEMRFKTGRSASGGLSDTRDSCRADRSEGFHPASSSKGASTGSRGRSVPYFGKSGDFAITYSGWEGAGVPVWRLGVHIADVSTYVPWGSAVDLDARNRAASVYLVDRVIPMLPERLSNDLCSLRPHEDRLSMTVDLYLDEQGRIACCEIYPAVIRSRARLTYDQVQYCLERIDAGEHRLLGASGQNRSENALKVSRSAQTLRRGSSKCPEDGKTTCSSRIVCPEARENAPFRSCAANDFEERRVSDGADDVSSDFNDIPDDVAERLAALSHIGRQRSELRRKAGGIDFPSTEAKVRLDADGRPIGVDLRRKNDATSLVEEAMILANEAVARCLVAAESPGLFRVHERPAADGLSALVSVFEEFGWFACIDKARFARGDSHAVQAVLEASSGRSEEELVGSLLLRAMKRADYRPVCEGHYGLASEAYAHFTSPIRRYPDLIVHHMVKTLLFGRSELYDQEASSLRWLGRHCSEREREADVAARESQELKLIELLEVRVGEAFSAVVSGVASHGLYVRLDNTAEGLLPASRLGFEYFALDAESHRLVGQDSGKIWRLGQRIAVVLTVADARRHMLEFRLAGETR